MYAEEPTDFDAGSLRFAEVENCAPHGGVFAWDASDVYILSPQSCGGANCGGNYTGYYWAALEVRSPSTFRWLAGGYATDGEHVYHQWHRGPIAGARPESLEIFLCGQSSEQFATDGVRWFAEGRAITEEELADALPRDDV